MCRNIKRLRQPGRRPSDEELRDAALQYVRKISGYRAPSQANSEAFESAVEDIVRVTRAMFDGFAPPGARPRQERVHAGT